MPLIEGIAYNYWRKLVNQNWSNVSGEIENAIKEYIERSHKFDYVRDSKLFKSEASPVEEEQDRIATSNKMRDEIIYILENFKGMRATYPLLHLFESKLKETNKTFKPKDSAHQTKPV